MANAISRREAVWIFALDPAAGRYRFTQIPQRVVEGDLVEMVLAGHQHDRADADAGGVGRHDELAEAGVAALGIEGPGAGEHDDLVRQVRATGPHLGPG